ncbi:MAG: hypothetical protein IT271_01845 [Chitinophagales bacterium]|nr:hypothetical protein [Chitinophagales bacterium]
MYAVILSILLFFSYDIENTYQKAATSANQLLLVAHAEADTFVSCNGKKTTIILKDSLLNAPGQIGTEYNYPIYKYETEITFYADKKLAGIEKKQIHLKRFEYLGVTTGIEKSTTIDSLDSFYFNQNNQPISRLQFLVIQKKICKENEE